MKGDADLQSRGVAIIQMRLDTYMDWLESPVWAERIWGINGLKGLDGVAIAAIPSLELLLSDPDSRVRKAAAIAVEHIRRCS